MPEQGRPLAGKRVLIVDDHEDSLEILRLILTHAGAYIVTSASLENALAVLSDTAVDAAITGLGFGDDPMAGPACLPLSALAPIAAPSSP
jgi:CheY-like chemotaxis protein